MTVTTDGTTFSDPTPEILFIQGQDTTPDDAITTFVDFDDWSNPGDGFAYDGASGDLRVGSFETQPIISLGTKVGDYTALLVPGTNFGNHDQSADGDNEYRVSVDLYAPDTADFMNWVSFTREAVGNTTLLQMFTVQSGTLGGLDAGEKAVLFAQDEANGAVFELLVDDLYDGVEDGMAKIDFRDIEAGVDGANYDLIDTVDGAAADQTLADTAIYAFSVQALYNQPDETYSAYDFWVDDIEVDFIDLIV